MSNRALGRRLRVAYIVGSFPSLSETFIANQIAGIAALGHTVDIYTTCAPESHGASVKAVRSDLMRHTYRLAESNRWRALLRALVLLVVTGWRAPGVVGRSVAVMWRDGGSGGLRLLCAALSLVWRGAREYDVIHAQFGPYGELAAELVAVGATRGAIVTSMRGYDLGRHLAEHPTAYRKLFRVGALFLPVSAALAEKLGRAGCDTRRIRVHHSGIACRRLPYKPRAAGDVGVRLVSVGRLVEKKGIAYAIHAIARVVAAGRKVSYTIVGDGPWRAKLERLVLDVGVSRQVRFVGAQPHDVALSLMDAAHILLAPSVTAVDGDEEGVPNVAKEAMALGLPVVATRHGGIPELVEDGVSGFLVPERDARALADRIIHLCDHPSQWAAIGRAGRERVEREYDIDRLTQELDGIYRDAIGEPALAAAAAAPALAIPQGAQRA
jgi:colanic acid/amylovoran biosynthesis glycosyltransferase